MKTNPIITDEMLAAYMAGNATAHETALILRAAETNPTIRGTLRVLSELEYEDEANVRPMMAMAAKNEVDNLCAIRCTGYALRHFGLDIADEQLYADALRSNRISDQGMQFGLLGELIRPYNLETQYVSHCSIDALHQFLSEGAVVIALVDGGELTGDLEQEKMEDLVEGLRPDHVVVVESLSSDSITICDSYTPKLLDTYETSAFLDAWEDSDRSVVIVRNL